MQRVRQSPSRGRLEQLERLHVARRAPVDFSGNSTTASGLVDCFVMISHRSSPSGIAEGGGAGIRAALSWAQRGARAAAGCVRLANSNSGEDARARAGRKGSRVGAKGAGREGERGEESSYNSLFCYCGRQVETFDTELSQAHVRRRRSSPMARYVEGCAVQPTGRWAQPLVACPRAHKPSRRPFCPLPFGLSLHPKHSLSHLHLCLSLTTPQSCSLPCSPSSTS